MSFFDRHSLYPARFGNIVLKQMFDVGMTTENSKTRKIVAGRLDPSVVITAFADPMVTIRTNDFDGVFAGGGDVVSIINGYDVNVLGGPQTNSTLIQYQTREDGATFKAAGNPDHIVLTNQKGFLLPRDISAEQDSIEGASIGLDYYALSEDGFVKPLIESKTTLTSVPTFSGIWYLGPVILGASFTDQLLGIQSVRVNPGITYQPKRAEGEPFAEVGSIISREPEIKITTCDIKSWESLLGELFGLALTSTIQVQVYFQKGIHGGRREDYDQALHYRVTAVTGDITPDEIQVTQLEDSRLEITLRVTEQIALTANTTIPLTP